ncbi:MAG: T9SS type A sorting domain-containing protein [Bacteroidia bacterium]|nr:T9SS type A sorting domain-containing protein [Bacteroidia bacterium]
MNKLFFGITLFFLLLCNYSALFSQSIQRHAFVSAASSNQLTAGYGLQSSIGELAVETNLGSTNALTQGFIQNEQPGVIVGTDQKVNLNFKTYPNPVCTSFSIEFLSNVSYDIHIEVFDAMGRKLNIRNERYWENDRALYVLNMEALNAGLYLVKAYSETAKFNQVFMVSKI